MEKIDTFFNFIIPEKQELSETAEEWKHKFENVVEAILNLRKNLKQDKKYAIADEIRDVLSEAGIQVMDDGNDYSWELK